MTAVVHMRGRNQVPCAQRVKKGWRWSEKCRDGGEWRKASVVLKEERGSVHKRDRLGRISGEGNGNPLQYSCLDNPTDGESWCRL